MSQRLLKEIMGRAIGEMREALGDEKGGVEEWDPDAFEEEVRQFTQELGQQLLQVWAEVKTEQSQAQIPFALNAEEDTTCTDGSPYGG
jgi:hypothetical protein